jgi:hypothetical protein
MLHKRRTPSLVTAAPMTSTSESSKQISSCTDMARVSKISRFEKYRETGIFFEETGKNREKPGNLVLVNTTLFLLI